MFYNIFFKSSSILETIDNITDNTINDIKELSVTGDIANYVQRIESENEKDNSFQYSLDYDNEIDDNCNELIVSKTWSL